MKTLVLISMLLMVACDGSSQRSYADKQQYFCHYYKDTRTDTCFVGSEPKHLDHDHALLSVVPCSPAVERLVEQWPDHSN
jgi:hypothetical protein